MDECKFKNTSKMDSDEITVFQNAVMKKTIFLTSVVFFLIFAGIGTGLAFWNLTSGIITGVCGIIGGFILLPYLMKENQKKQNASVLGDKTYLNTYEFFEDSFVISTQASKPDSKEYEDIASQKLYYQDIYKVMIYREHLFIFINPRQSFILNFKGMTKGTAGEVIELFKAKNIKIQDKSAK